MVVSKLHAGFFRPKLKRAAVFVRYDLGDRTGTSKSHYLLNISPAQSIKRLFFGHTFVCPIRGISQQSEEARM